jgi:hypothetical protein
MRLDVRIEAVMRQQQAIKKVNNPCFDMGCVTQDFRVNLP